VKDHLTGPDPVKVCVCVVGCIILVPISRRSTRIEVVGEISCRVEKGTEVGQDIVEKSIAHAKNGVKGWLKGTCRQFGRSKREMDLEYATELARMGFEGMGGGMPLRQWASGRSGWREIKSPSPQLVFRALPSVGSTYFQASALIDTTPKTFAAFVKLRDRLEGWTVAVKKLEHGIMVVEIEESGGGRDSALKLVVMEEKRGGGSTSVVNMDGERKNVGWVCGKGKGRGHQGGGGEFVGFSLLYSAYTTFHDPERIDRESIGRLSKRMRRGGEEYSVTEAGMLQKFNEAASKEHQWVNEGRAEFDQYVTVSKTSDGIVKLDFDVDGKIWDVMSFDFLDDLRVREKEFEKDGVLKSSENLNQHSRIVTLSLKRRKWKLKVRWMVTKDGVGKIFREGGDMTKAGVSHVSKGEWQGEGATGRRDGCAEGGAKL
jgi:hypothetical protein